MTPFIRTSLPIWAEDNKLRRLTVDQEIAVPVNKVVTCW